MLSVQFGQATNFGKVRTNNEDAMGSFVPTSRQHGRTHGYLFAVADGVGGSDLGEVASATAIEVLCQGFANQQAGSMLASLMPKLIQHANAAVHDKLLEPEYRGKSMATTVVSAALRHDQATVSWVGDSRCYLIRAGRARAISQDHSWVQQQIKLGLMSEQDAKESEKRHILLRSIGPEMFTSADTVTINIEPEDVLLLCSDGVHDEMPEKLMAEILSQKKPAQELVDELVMRAVEIDGGDNTTAQVVVVKGVEQVGMYRGRPYKIQS